MFSDRFEGSLKPPGSRWNLSFAGQLMHLGAIKDEWDFIENETLRSNIASELQKIHFDVLLMNHYNVYYSPEAMTMKHAIIAAASVAEAVLEVAVRMIEDDPRVRPIIETRERVFDEMYTLQLREFEGPEGTRVVAGVQREVVRTRLDRNTKMDLLIRAAEAGEVIGGDLARKLQQLRRLRNRVHIKTVEELEYASYKHGLANASLNILEEFRLAAKAWIDASHSPNVVEVLVQRVAPPPVPGLSEGYVDWGPPLVTAPPEPEPPFVTGPPDFGPPDPEPPFVTGPPEPDFDFGPAEPDFGSPADPDDDIPW